MYEIICNLAREVSLPHLKKLNSYLEKNTNVGIEKWFQVELTVKLLEKYDVIVSQPVLVGNRKLKPDLKIKRNKEYFLLELKAGALWGEIWKIQKDAHKFPECANFLGCLFLGRFEQSKEVIQDRLQKNGSYSCHSLEQVGNGKPQWWVGILRKET